MSIALTVGLASTVTGAIASATTTSTCVASGSATYANDYPTICTTYPKVYKDEVDFVVVCNQTNTAYDDPILMPGKEGQWYHEHRFVGEVGTASDTATSLLTKPTNCGVSANHTLYWTPTLFRSDGTRMTPYTARNYYRVGTTVGARVVPFPPGLKMIAGDSMATAPQPGTRVGFYCRTIGVHVPTVPKQSTPLRCPSGTVLAVSVIFPNCWDGANLFLPGNAHLAYSTGTEGTCPAGWKNIPQLTEELRYDQDGIHPPTEDGMYLSSMNSPYTYHADVLEAWSGATLNQLVAKCLNASVHCGDVSDRRLPGGVTELPAVTASAPAPSTTTAAPTTSAMPTPAPSSTTTAPTTSTSAPKPAPTTSAAPAPTSTAPPLSTGSSVTVAADADATVDSAHPDRNYGRSTDLHADGKPVVRAWLHFRLPAASAGARYRLHVYANSSVRGGLWVATTTGGWAESTITWHTAPTLASPRVTIGAATASRWLDIDVTALVSSGTSGTTLVVGNDDDTAISLGGRASATAPYLTVS